MPINQKEVIVIYCNSCMTQIAKDDITHCEQCNVPLHNSCANHCLVCGKVLCDSCYVENEYKCEECFKPDDTFAVIRRSYLKQYADCPYSLYLQLVKGILPPMGRHAQLGVIVHELIDEDDRTLEETHAELDRRIAEWNMGTDDEYSIITVDLETTGHTCIDNFWLIKPMLGGKFTSEKKIKFSLDDNLPMISCTIDRISFVGDDLVISDWKTGKPMSGRRLVTDLQPPLYLYAAFKEYGKMPKSFNLHYLKSNKTLSYDKVDDDHYTVKTSRNTYTLDIPAALERTRKILDSIQRRKFNMPSNGSQEWMCRTLCWYGLSGKCAADQERQWKEINQQRKSA